MSNAAIAKPRTELPPAERDALGKKVKERKRAGKTIAEIATELGITESRATYFLYRNTPNGYQPNGNHKTKKGKKEDDIKRSEGSKDTNNAEEQAYAIHGAYLSGKIEQIVRAYAESQQLSLPILAEGLAKSLHSIARG